MPPTVVEPKAPLDVKQRAWLKEMGAALNVNIGGPSSQSSATGSSAKAAGNADLLAKYQQIKAAIVPKVPPAVAADPSKKDEIKRLLETASKHASQGVYEEAVKSLTTLSETLKGVAKTDVAELQSLSPSATADDDKTKSARKDEEWYNVHYFNLTQNQGIKAIDPAKLKTLGDQVISLDALIKAQNWSQFYKVGAEIQTKLATYRDTANRHGDYVGLRANGLLMVKSLEAHPNKGAIAAEISEIKTQLIDKAKTVYEAGNDAAGAQDRYDKAWDLLSQVPKKYKAAVNIADRGAKTTYITDREAAKLKLKSLETAEKKPIVSKQITDIRAKLDLAEKRAGVNQYSKALKLIADAVKDCDDAEKLAKQQLEYSNSEKAAGAATKNLATNPKAAVEAVEKLYAQLKGHSQASVIAMQLAEIHKKIEKAKTLLPT